MSVERPPPFFIADAKGLDFLNTAATPHGEDVEWLADGEDLTAWLRAAELVPDEALAKLRATALPGELDVVAAQARSLREWFRSFVQARKGAPLPPEALAELAPLNQILERDELFGAITPKDEHAADGTGAFGWALQRHWRTPNALLAPIATALADVVCNADFAQIKQCEGPSCRLIFLDLSRRRARRWCSMAVCGNRAKQASHRSRTSGRLTTGMA